VSGTVGVIADLAGRYSQFWGCLNHLRKPVNTAGDFEFGADRARSRNNLVRRSLDRGSEWIMFLDDDQTFKPSILTEALAVGQPVVAALYTQRVAPYLPIAYADKDDVGYWPLDLRNHGPNELVQVRAAGTGGMLIRSEVFRELGDIHWFMHTTEQSEDMFFCDRLAEAGIPMFVHTGVRLGHIAPAVVFPDWDDERGEWVAGLQFSHTTSVRIDMGWDVLDQEVTA